jgi:hypothetical protein
LENAAMLSLVRAFASAFFVCWTIFCLNCGASSWTRLSISSREYQTSRSLIPANFAIAVR